VILEASTFNLGVYFKVLVAMIPMVKACFQTIFTFKQISIVGRLKQCVLKGFKFDLVK
jgi:hypothetical protein